TESASFWLSVLTDLKARGVEDILSACTDNLKDLPMSSKVSYPDDHLAVHCPSNPQQLQIRGLELRKESGDFSVSRFLLYELCTKLIFLTLTQQLDNQL